MVDMRHPKVGLALGAGGLRGIAHVGVLQVLKEEGIPVDLVAGTSIGAIVGALYACGMSPEEMAERSLALTERQFVDIIVPRQGFMAGNRAEALVRLLTGGRTFEQTDLPFAAVACNFETMEPVVFREGPLHKAVRASISIPGVFAPVERDGELLVDGGLLRRVPADVARAMGADVVIGVDVGYRGTRQRTSSIIEHVMHAIDILGWRVAQHTASEADAMIAPDTSFMNPIRLGKQAAECIERGRAAAQAMVPDIREMIEKNRQTTA